MSNISGSRGTTFIRHYLAIATSLGTSDVIGRRSTHPITGITGKVYFRRAGGGLVNRAPTPLDPYVDFFLQHQGLFHGSYAMGFPPIVHSLDAT